MELLNYANDDTFIIVGREYFFWELRSKILVAALP